MGVTEISGIEKIEDYLPPPLKWAGGKRLLVPRLAKIWEPFSHRRLVEPFVGGMAVALGLRPRTALLGDVNAPLIHFYKWLQRGLVVEMPYHNDDQYYYLARTRFNELIDNGQVGSKEAAELVYYLNKTSYNGLWRVNSRGLHNVPFGKYTTINYQRDFSAYASVLRKWDLQIGDFAVLLAKADNSDFIYCDPPYDVEFTDYSPGGFAWDDQVRLARRLAQHPGPVVASNQATPRVIELYQNLRFKIELIDASRRISCNGDRTPAREILATKNLNPS